MRRCEDCGEPARWKTADGVWLCDGDFDALLDAVAVDEYEPPRPANPVLGGAHNAHSDRRKP